MTRAHITILTVLCLNGIFTQVQSNLSTEDKTEIVNTHNRLRREFATTHGVSNGGSVSNMRKLEWSTQIERFAQATVDLQCARLLMSSNNGYSSNKNINSTGDFTGDIISWYRNITRLFLPIFGACMPYQSCQSAYTMLNANHQHIGCAYRENCGERNTFMCLYEIHNDQSDYVFYKPGPVCTRCEDETPFCEDGLCVSCDNSHSNCECRKTCNGGGVGNGTLDSSTCTCTCQYGWGPNCDEPCENRQMYVDYDMCAELTDYCDYPEFDQMLREFCPALCHCKPFPVE